MERSGRSWDGLLKRYRISGIVDTDRGQPPEGEHE